MIILFIGAAGFALGFGAYALRKLGRLDADPVLDPIIMMLVAGATLACQLAGESVPSIVTQCAWLAIGSVSLLRTRRKRSAPK